MNTCKLHYASNCGFSFRHFLTKTNEMNVEPHNVSHCHPQCEIYLFVSGEAEFKVAEHSYKMNHGDVLVIEGGEHHSFQVNPNCDYERYVVEIDLDLIPELKGTRPLKGCFNKSLHAIHLSAKAVRETPIVKIFKSIEKACTSPRNRFTNHLVFGDIVRLVSEVNRCFEEEANPQAEIKGNSKYDEALNLAIEYIKENMNRKITVDDLCDQIHFSRSYFQHIFKERTGLSITDYILRQKMTSARYMLQNGIPLNEVADALGYKYYSLFSTHYKRFFGVSPKNH